MIPDWELLFVLPNLNLDEVDEKDLTNLTLGTDLLAVVPSRDRRVQQIAETAPAARLLLNAFRGSECEPFRPAALIIRRDAVQRVASQPEAIFAFRNSVALAHVLSARAKAPLRGGGQQVWTDFWDIHPTSITTDGTGLVTYSPAVRGYWPQPERYCATSSDALPRNLWPASPDDYLLRAFSHAWKRRYYVSPERDVRWTRVLFRSLETAYQACSVGGRHYGSYYEYGTAIALWVSAIEILAAPPPTRRRHKLQPGQKRRRKATGNVTPRHVVDLLGHHQWSDRWLRHKRYKVTLARDAAAEPVNFIQRVYVRMYEARSRFLHGDHVSPSLLRLPGGTSTTVTRLASHVYWTALIGFLKPHFPAPFGVGWFSESDVEQGIRAEVNR